MIQLTETINELPKIFSTPNDYFNTIIGGGYEEGRVYLFIIEFDYKGILDTLNISAREEIANGDIRHYENVIEPHEMLAVKLSAQYFKRPAIVVNYVPDLTDISIRSIRWFDILKQTDTNIAIHVDVENVSVRYEVMKQRTNVSHGLMNPYKQKIQL